VNFQLAPTEARVLGSLIEKEITTPEYYPLSLNALLNACNQKSNRDPVMGLDEEAERQQSALECKRTALEAQVAALRAEFSAEETMIARIFSQDKQREASAASDKVEMGRSRQHDILSNGGPRRAGRTKGKHS